MEAAPMVFPVRYVSEGAAIQTTSRGLSGEGIAVRSLVPPSVGARVSMALYLPGNPKPEVAVGVVAASTRDRPVPAGFWVHFTAIDVAARERIAALVVEKARTPGPTVVRRAAAPGDAQAEGTPICST